MNEKNDLELERELLRLRDALARANGEGALAQARLELMSRQIEDLRLQNYRLDAQYSECRIGRAVADERAAAAREAAGRRDEHCCCGGGPNITATFFGGVPGAGSSGYPQPPQVPQPPPQVPQPPPQVPQPPPQVPQPPPQVPQPPQPEPNLKSAKITFSLPEGDDKDDNTTVSVVVTSKVNNQFDMRIASLEGFGGQQVWEDDGAHSYSYDLNVSEGIKLSEVKAGGIKTKIEWAPVQNDRGFFNYRLVLRFSDGTELEQTNPQLIEMSENIRTYTNP